MRVVTLSICLGVSLRRQVSASADSCKPYFLTTFSASLQVDESTQAGPLAIISSGSPKTSLRTTHSTCAGAHAIAKRPPFTADNRLRMVLISTISAPHPSSCCVISCNSSKGIQGFSSRALPPPDRRNTTVSCAVNPCTRSSAACVPRQEPSSGTGCPPSKQRIWAIGPFICPYFVTTTPSAIRFPRQSDAAFAICHAAFPAATRTIFPVPKRYPCSARTTATSGKTA